MTPARVLEGVRLSELARCPRACALRGLGAEPTEPSGRQRRWMSRGQIFGMYAALQFEQLHGKGNVEREREVPWPLGTGHADIYIRPEKLLIEVVSSTSPDGILPAKIRQVRRYLHFDPEAERAAVYVINPADLDREDLIPVELRDEDVDEIEDEVSAVQEALAGGDLPDCSASTPTECRLARFCSFTDVAWAGWFPPPATELPAAPDVVALLVEWTACKTAEAEHKAAGAANYERRREVQALLAEHGVEAGTEYAVGGFSVKRQVRAGSASFSLARARSSGTWTPGHDEMFAPFLKVGDPSEMWAIKKLGETDLDFGEEAPF